ncbi:MAG: hypothetical protein WAM82_06630 [Thermoanaerobaculia bacterium]
MKYPHHLTRALLTFFGFAAFIMLAFGSRQSHHDSDYSAYSPPPEVVGRENALTWAKSNSADLKKKIYQVEMRRNHAQSEVRKLETLKEQFPADANKTEERRKEWQRVVIELDSALTAVTQSASSAYLAHRRDGENSGAVLGEVYSQWGPTADRAIALAKKQRAKSGD